MIKGPKDLKPLYDFIDPMSRLGPVAKRQKTEPAVTRRWSGDILAESLDLSENRI